MNIQNQIQYYRMNFVQNVVVVKLQVQEIWQMNILNIGKSFIVKIADF